ncbi:MULTISPECIES: hypothetical protein [Butyricimonas]
MRKTKLLKTSEAPIQMRITLASQNIEIQLKRRAKPI